MKAILISLGLLLSVIVVAQTPNIPLGKNLVGYRGNPIEWRVTMNLVDSSASVSVRAKYGPNDRMLETTYQPTITRSGRIVTLRWSGTQTEAMPAESWYELKVGNVIQLAGTVSISKTPQATAPGSVTLTQYVVVPAGSIGGGPSAPGNLTRFYNLNAVSNGHVLTHSGGSKLVTGGCFDQQSGLADPLWRVEPIDDNTAVLRGPPTETFTGTVVVTVFQRLTY